MKYSNLAMGKIMQPEVAGNPVMLTNLKMTRKQSLKFKDSSYHGSKKISQKRNESLDLIAHDD